MCNWSRIWVGLLPALVLVVVAGAESETKLRRSEHPDRPMSIFEADQIIYRVIDGEGVDYWHGNVFIDRDSLTAKADTAVHYRDREFYQFFGNVEFMRFGSLLTCRWADYDRKSGAGNYHQDVRWIDGTTIGTGRLAETRQNGRRVSLIGDALLVAPDYTVRADTITRDRVTGQGEAFGNVRIMEPSAKNLVTGEHAVFMDEGDVAEVDRDPVLTSREQSSGPLRSTAGVMRFFREQDKVVMVDSVHITQGETVAIADTAVAYGRELLVLTGNPEVSMNRTSSMRGDRIDFHYIEEQLRRVVLIGSAHMEDSTPDSLAAVYRGLPRMDVLEGDSISIDFKDEKIRRSTVVGAARSMYTPTDLSDEVATNDVTGDTIIIDFRDERVHRVNVIGQMAGTYKFARVVAMREMLGQSKRLADMLARTAIDSTGTDSLLVGGEMVPVAIDTLRDALRDSLRVTLQDSTVMAQVDSLAGRIGLPPPSRVPGGEEFVVMAVDSLLTAAMDSLAAAGYDTSVSALDFLSNAEAVRYSGGRVMFDMAEKSIDIRDDGKLDYGTMSLTADHIILDTVDRVLYAEGEPKIDDNETIVGERMGYDFQHRTGAVSGGTTSFEEYYYVGEEIKRFSDTTLKICKGKMTSCDLAEPHYHFWSSKMKIRMDDKVVAKPIVVRIGNVPVFALPFYFKSLKSGRRSGILFPSFEFGWSDREGRYIRDFGYYWATNDYMDFIFEGDYNERRELGLRVSNRYVKRYAFTGGVDYSRRIGLGDSDLREWQLRWNHNQPTLFDDYKFRSDVKLASQTLSNNDLSGSSRRDVVSGELASSLYVSRNWSLVNTNLSASRKEYINATDDDPATNNLLSSMTLPSLTLGFRDIALASQPRAGQRAGLMRQLMSSTYFKHNYSLKYDETGYEEKTVKDYQAAGAWGLSLRPPRVGIFNVNFSANAGQTWTRQTIEGRNWVVEEDSTTYWDPLDEETENTNPRLTFGAGVGTTLYGLLPVGLGRLQTLRHTFRTNVGWTLAPGLGSKQSHSTSYTFSMSNRFDVKYLSGDADSTLAEKKLDGLIDWSLSTSYRPKAAAGQRWSSISSGLTIKPGEASYLRLKVNNTIDPNTLSLLSTSFSYALNFRGKLDLGIVNRQPERQRSGAIDRLGTGETAADSLAGREVAPGFTEDGFRDSNYEQEQDPYFEGERDAFYDFYQDPMQRQSADGEDVTEGGRFIPFNVNTSLSYRYTNSSRTKRASANLGVSANLSRNWEFRYTASFDLAEGVPVRQQYSLKRDLHCWRLEFNRTISNVDSQFGFRIYLKTIPDLKVTRGREDGMGSAAGSFGGGLY